ncbi:MAG: hypothetical protein RTS72_07025 [Candidatus Thorarchaeota archaeon]
MQSNYLKYLRALLLLLLIFPTTSIALQSSSGSFGESTSDLISSRSSNFVDGGLTDPIDKPDFHFTNDVATLADSTGTPLPAIGNLDPVQVEQSGYSSTGNISARTDTMLNTEQTLSIDGDHNWVASAANVDLWNLNKMYVENGTLEVGTPGVNIDPTGSVPFHPLGWDANSTTADVVQTQVASYSLGTESYVTVENQGTPTGPAPDRDYLHTMGTNVSWTQDIVNTPFTEDFILRFKYFYFRGPIGDVFAGNCSIMVYVDGSLAWRMSLLVVEQRGVWFDSGDIIVSRSGIGSSFKIEIGLSIDETMVLDPNTDYDIDGYLDGIQNTFYITTFFDDISLISASPPDCDEVGLEFSVNGSTSQITGALGTGFGQIVNQSYWNTTSLSFLIFSNTSVSFEYNVRLLNHRFLDSSYTTDTLSTGVAYTIDSGKSGRLELFTYLGFLGIYEELTLNIYHASDWEKFTVYNPFLSNVTSYCALGAQSISIPESILDSLGWWKITCDAPNYASSAVVERYDSGWVNESIFHSDDNARLSVSLGTGIDTPVLSDPVNFTWALSNCTTWYESSTTSGFDGNTSSSTVTFGPTNTTAGMWGVRYLWSNGTELAYDCAIFALHHTAILESVYSDPPEIPVGQLVSVFLRFLDAENGLYILNDGASVVGNWSGSDVEFVPDIVKNWWQADFDTALVGAGDFTISIVSAAPYFETIPLVITVKSQFETNLDPPSGPLTPLVYGREYSYDFFYSMSYNGTGIDGANVNITEAGSEWTSISNTGNGHYDLTISPMATGDYNIRITLSKEGYKTQSHVLSFLVDHVPVEVESISDLVALEQTPLDVEVHIIESDTGNSVTGANVTLGVYRPGGVIYFYSEMEETSAGTYTLTVPMPPSESGTYTVRISVEKTNHEMVQSFSAALVPMFDSNIRIMQTLLRYSWQIGIGVIIIVGVVAGQRSRTRKNRKKHSTAMEIKNRFDDANNVLGFLVLHKMSGVPIYSKIFKGGFEEGMLSAFISAIMHFRAELETGGEPDPYTIIPISEVIRTVPTENLICAFITVTPPSVEQEARMKSYARAIGMMFDATLAEQSVRVLDAKASKTFEWMFDDFMDGILIRKYQVGEKKFPKRLKFIENTIPIEATDGVFNLVRLVRLLTSSGLSEDEVYLRVLETIEGEYIQPVYPYNSEVLTESD